MPAVTRSLAVAALLACHLTAAAGGATPLVYVRYPRVGPTPAGDGSGWFGNLYDEPYFAYSQRCFGNPGGSGAPACPPGYSIPQAPPLPEVRDLYRVIPGGDIVLRRADGSERVVIAHDESAPAGTPVGSVLDLNLSPDAQWMVWAEVVDARAAANEAGVGSRIDLQRAYIGDEASPAFGVVHCLTCALDYQFNRFKGWDPALDAAAVRAVVGGPVFVAPVWLPDGRILFGSTIAAEAISGLPDFYDERVDFFATSQLQPALQLWTIDADGSNLTRITPALPTRLQHPTLMADGRIIATSWEMAFRRRIHNGFSLVELKLDGSGYRQFSHRHQVLAAVPHFAAALPSGELCAVEYYNGQTFGFGSLWCAPGAPAGPVFSDDPLQAWGAFLAQTPGASWGEDLLKVAWSRPFGQFEHYPDRRQRQERMGARLLTPRMSNFDVSTADWSGRVTQPAPGPDGSIYLVWSRGGVNRAEGGGLPADAMPRPDAGIYWLASGSSAPMLDPQSQLLRVVDTPAYHEMWPRPLLPRASLFSDAAPPAPPSGEPYGWLEGASVRARLTRPDGVDRAHGAVFPETAWLVQGTEAGITADADVVGVRVLAVIPEGLSRPWSPDFPHATQYQARNRSWWSPALDRVVILGEVPVLKRDADGQLRLNPQDSGQSGQVQPDTSFRIRVPAGVAIFQQGLDRRGLATATETTWHALASGEHKRCQGCHWRTAELPRFEDSIAGQNQEWTDVAEATPLFAGIDARGDPTLESAPGRVLHVEWQRDVAPVLAARCQSCHQGEAPAGGLALDGSIATYRRLAVPQADSETLPQVSPWTRMLQARQSRLAWYLWGERLDGRPDAGDPAGRGGFDWSFDRTRVRQNHPPAALTDAERRRVARWIDIGMPIDLSDWHLTQDPANAAWKSRRGYLGDDLPPTLIPGGLPWTGAVCASPLLRIGLWDDGGFGPAPLSVRVDGGANLAGPVSGNGVVEIALPALADGAHAVEVVLVDLAGNRSSAERRFAIDRALCVDMIFRSGFEPAAQTSAYTSGQSGKDWPPGGR